MDPRERGAGWVRLGPRSSAVPCAALGFWCIYLAASWLASQARDWTDTWMMHAVELGIIQVIIRARYLSLEASSMQKGNDAVNLLSSAEVRSQSGRRDRLDLTGVGVVELMIVASSPRR